jgi:hypothetical protein
MGEEEVQRYQQAPQVARAVAAAESQVRVHQPHDTAHPFH